MKLARPKMPISLADATVGMMVNDGELKSMYVHDEDAINCNVVALQLMEVLFENVQFTGAQFSRVVARDVIFRQTNLSSAYIDNGMLVRVEFVNCRMTGADFSYTSIHDVIFRDCKLDRVSFYKADLRRVSFISCDVQESDLAAATRIDITFQ